jgi:hypothetical protein
VGFCGRVMAWMADHWDEVPERLNLLDPVLPTKRDLLHQLKLGNPDLTVIWLPTVLLVPLSWLAIGLQKVLRPGRPAIDVAKVFAVQDYETRQVAALVSRLPEEGSSRVETVVGAGRN